MMGLILVLTHCSKNPQSPATLTNSNGLSKTSLVRFTGMDLKAEFEELATLLAQRAPRVIEKIMAIDKLEALFSELDLDAELPRLFVMGDGRILETTLERAQPCKVTPTSFNSPIIFAPDPDRFQRDEENHICTGWQVENGKITLVSFTLDEYVNSFSKIPLYLVGYREQPKDMKASTPFAQTGLSPKSSVSTAASGDIYVACHKIHMKKDHDPWSNEETQVFTKPPGGSQYNFLTGLIFSEPVGIFSRC
jgi:hypothetical protein